MGVSRSFNAIKCWIHNSAAATLSHISQRKALGTGGKGAGVRRIKDYQGCYNPLRALLLRLVITELFLKISCKAAPGWGVRRCYAGCKLS